MQLREFGRTDSAEVKNTLFKVKDTPRCLWGASRSRTHCPRSSKGHATLSSRWPKVKVMTLRTPTLLTDGAEVKDTLSRVKSRTCHIVFKVPQSQGHDLEDPNTADRWYTTCRSKNVFSLLVKKNEKWIAKLEDTYYFRPWEQIWRFHSSWDQILSSCHLCPSCFLQHATTANMTHKW